MRRCFRATCFGHRKKIKNHKHQPPQQPESVPVPIALKEEEIASLLQFVAQSQSHYRAENEEESDDIFHNSVENRNGNAKNKKKEEEALVPYPKDDSLIVDKENDKMKMTPDDNPKEDDRCCPGQIQMESSDSLFSLSIDSRKHDASAAETGEKEVSSRPPLKPLEENSPYEEDKENANSEAIVPYSKQAVVKQSLEDEVIALDTSHSSCSQYEEDKENVNSKAIAYSKQAVVKQSLDDDFIAVDTSLSCYSSYEEDKENVNSEAIVPYSKQAVVKKSMDEVIAVDTSLSSWLAGPFPDCTNCGSSPESEKNYGGDRQILATISQSCSKVEKVKKLHPIPARVGHSEEITAVASE
ncbi:uncharacterized protein LOC127244893 isoform X2 [Andrographis paniculata]|uniref:uncharacterized protein LOC127244893 isoform X2 n=1 Tax=Andrographis paniculata TaxID=175694 RepID=UPI0021E80E77|nr:uncharacterized protein LOC127244893 isoform X2 [Andrographis paniculata]